MPVFFARINFAVLQHSVLISYGKTFHHAAAVKTNGKLTRCCILAYINGNFLNKLIVKIISPDNGYLASDLGIFQIGHIVAYLAETY